MPLYAHSLSPVFPDRTSNLLCLLAVYQEPSVILLISHLAQDISPGSENWIHNLCQLLEKYLRY
ncbi:hypothetical protein DPMN_025447 [Dreissena polymorpha]|uniref:Uncharacterized protein n=1 Tax=Dreissena polymorpha TaxID=45954 RepID=A0A9D4LQS8_DREPO|nr:hypothetical protein DPMN_025447 [Dreissena polymorpha]